MNLLRHPQNATGRIHRITPDDAGWTYVGFEVFRLFDGEAAEGGSEARETCIVIVSGRADVAMFGVLGERDSPFDGAPWSVYLPPRTPWSVVARGDCEFAVCTAPATGRLPARVIPPSEVDVEVRGTGTNTRRVRNILPDSSPHAESLLVVEVVTPGGNWSSYPPHKHDVDDPPRETLLEETYYHRLARGAGFAVQRVYTDDGSLDQTMAVADGDVVLVPRGYHPVGAPYGFDLYYLNVMAGPVREWRFTMAPDHAFLSFK